MSVGNIRSVSVGITANGRQLGEEAEIKAQMFSFRQMLNRITTSQFSTKTAFLPNCLLAVRSFSFDCQN